MPAVVGSMLKNGSQVDVADDEQNTALHYAAGGGYRDITALLLQ